MISQFHNFYLLIEYTNIMNEVGDESAKHIYGFGVWFKRSLVLALIVSIVSAGVGFIPIEIVYIGTLILLRITSITLLIFRVIMCIHLFNANKSIANKNLLFGFIFFLFELVLSLLNNGLDIAKAFIAVNAIGFLAHLTNTFVLGFEILFWIFFQRFFKGMMIEFFDFLLKRIKIYLVVLIISFAISIVYYFDILNKYTVMGLFFVVLILALTQLIYQFKIANGIIKNFRV
jgi:hypothetical protein